MIPLIKLYRKQVKIPAHRYIHIRNIIGIALKSLYTDEKAVSQLISAIPSVVGLLERPPFSDNPLLNNKSIYNRFIRD